MMPWIPSIPPEIIEGVVAVTGTLMTYIVPVVIVFNLYLFGKFVYNYVMTLRVTGAANEWVVIMEQGEEVKSGIGLSCFRTPFQQVAKFPSNLVKVEVRTQ